MLLMDIANRLGGIVLGTGDLSELALGWATYNGDHISMYGVNAGVPKTLVKYLVRYFARQTDDNVLASTLHDIIDTPISPELIRRRQRQHLPEDRRPRRPLRASRFLPLLHAQVRIHPLARVYPGSQGF